MDDDQHAVPPRDPADCAQQSSQSWSSTVTSSSMIKPCYAFLDPTYRLEQTAPHSLSLPWWRSPGDLQGFGLDSLIQSFEVQSGPAEVYNQPSYNTVPTNEGLPSDADLIQQGEQLFSQSSPAAFSPFLQPDLPLDNTIGESNASHEEISGPFDQSTLEVGNDAFPSFNTPGSIPAVAVQPWDLVVTQPMLLGMEAVVMQRSDGLFFCSQVGCDTTYSSIGDCRRHLKKHNGPFFHCEKHGCGMEFYRHDKLRDHMKQGHGIVIPPPGNRRRQRRGVTGQ